MPEEPRRYRILGWLAGFVVLVGAVSWLVTGRIGTHDVPPTPSHPPAITAVPTLPAPPDCRSDELSVVGGFDECAIAAPDVASICTPTYQMGVEDQLQFAGNSQDFVLDVEIDGGFTGPGKYALHQWSNGLGTRDGVAKVEVDEYSTETVWQSVSGVLTITSSGGLSGSVNAILQVPSVSEVPGESRLPTLTISGPWSCP
jgi:hypothetical protein